ncbi:MAG: methyl-accepting chemotaxis protein [Treponema sp.]|nr:methyl-accepting chemotaxis protein [Treponema sp.]
MSKKIFLTVLFLSILSSVTFAKSKQIPMNAEWKYRAGDNHAWSSPDFNTSSWQSIKLPGVVNGDENKFFWLTTTVNVPSEFRNADELFLEFGGTTASYEIYAGGLIVGRHGTIEPKATLCRVENAIASVPGSAVKDGKLTITIRGKCNADVAVFEPFYFINKDRYITLKTYHPFLNSTVYYMMAAICFFLGLYFLLQILADRKDKSNLSFCITLITVAIYFYVMASPTILLPFIIQLGISRLCLLISICFLVLFLREFFKLKNKITMYVASGLMGIFTILYVISFKSLLFQDTVFTLSLIPIFSGIIYIYIILARAKKAKKDYAGIMLIGISFGMLFGIHDIVYQIINVTPFAWLQGFAFFFIDLTMFVVVSIDTIHNKVKIGNLIASTTEQKERLDEIIKNAVELSKETIEVAQFLNDSVVRVANAADESVEKANEIGDFINLQNKSVENTSDAVANLVNSVENIKGEVQNETEVVETAVAETRNMVEGVNQVAAGIENAANFASSLGELTEKTSENVHKLVNIMDSIKESSTEIVNIAQVVSSFSQKTNMLAMNASIEAAHSGAAGAGFAVIAHEIKNLAASSAVQVDKINDIVSTIERNISEGLNFSINVNDALKTVSKEAKGTSEHVNESARSLEVQRLAGTRITSASAAMSESALRVKAETSQQYTYSQQVSANMMELADYSSKAASAVKDIMNRNKELSGQTSALQDLAKRAKEAAEKMNELINS